MAEDLIVWIWRGLITLGLGGIIRLLLWQRRVDTDLVRLQKDTKRAGENLTELKTLPLELERHYLKKVDVPDLKALQEHGQRLAVLQSEFEKHNVSDEVAVIHRRVDEVAKMAAEQAGQLKQINNTLHLIQQHLLGGKT